MPRLRFKDAMGRFRPHMLDKIMIPPHGSHIYVYNHAKTNQTVYSLEERLKGGWALKQLPDMGKYSRPPRLNHKQWRPFVTIKFPSVEQGLAAYQLLREYKRVRDLSWRQLGIEPPLFNWTTKRSKTATDLQWKEEFERLSSRPLRMRRKNLTARKRFLMDQVAGCVADIAAVLKRQEDSMSDRSTSFTLERGRFEEDFARCAKLMSFNKANSYLCDTEHKEVIPKCRADITALRRKSEARDLLQKESTIAEQEQTGSNKEPADFSKFHIAMQRAQILKTIRFQRKQVERETNQVRREELSLLKQQIKYWNTPRAEGEAERLQRKDEEVAALRMQINRTERELRANIEEAFTPLWQQLRDLREQEWDLLNTRGARGIAQRERCIPEQVYRRDVREAMKALGKKKFDPFKSSLANHAPSGRLAKRFTMDGVHLSWANILDTERAESWPIQTIHSPMVTPGYGRAIPPSAVYPSQIEETPAANPEPQPEQGWRSWIPSALRR